MERDPLSSLLSSNITRLMDARGIKADELAARSGLNRTAVYDILAGRSQSPRLKTVAQIAVALAVPITDLLMTVEQIEGQASLLRAYKLLPPVEQERLAQIARAWLAPPETD
jgi:transcriptional regulator with XRE-family HTH domain